MDSEQLVSTFRRLAYRKPVVSVGDSIKKIDPGAIERPVEHLLQLPADYLLGTTGIILYAFASSVFIPTSREIIDAPWWS